MPEYSDEIVLLFSLQRDVLAVIFAITVLLIIISYIGPKIIFMLYEKKTLPVIQDVIKSLIYKLDEYADEMSDREKRNITIDKIHDLISFNGIKIPRFICGWIVDIQVKRIRELQEECSEDSNLHK